MKSKVWWWVYKGVCWIVSPLEYTAVFLRSFVWCYTWYRYGGGKHIGDNGFIGNIRYAHRCAIDPEG